MTATTMIQRIANNDPTLTECDLFSSGIPNISELAEALKSNRSLSKLNLGWNKFGNVGGVALAGALKVNIALTDLNLALCDLTDIKELSDALKSNRYLSKLDLSSNKFGSAGVAVLVGALKVNVVLTDLNLCLNDLTDIKELAQALKSNHSLLELDLCSNKFGPAGGVALAGALKVNVALTALNLCGNDLTDIKDLAEALKSNRSLSRLYLADNAFGPAGGVALAGALKVNVALTKLDLFCCDLTDIQELAEALKSNRSLLNLYLAHNKFGPAGGIALADALKVNPTLETINVNGCGIETAIEKQINDKCAQNKSLKAQKKQNSEKEKDSKAIAAAATTASSNQTAAAVSLDKETIDKLKALPEKHETLAQQVQRLAVIDAVTLEVLVGRADQLQRMFEADAKTEFHKQEKDLINSNASLQVYYQFFARLLNGTWMACQSINSGMVANGESYKSDYVAKGLDEIGQRIPGIGLATGFFSGVIKGWNSREKKLAVQRMSLLFPDLETAFKELSQFARQVTLAQSKEISSMQPPQGIVAKIKERAKDLAAFILASDVNTPLKRKAEEDCQKLLTAIKEGKLPQQATLNDLLCVVMGTGFKYESPVSATSKTSPKAVAPSSQSASSPTMSPNNSAVTSPSSPSSEVNVLEMAEELRRMKIKEAEREAREVAKEAEIKRLNEKVAKLETQLPSDNDVESGNGSNQPEVFKSKQSATAASSAANASHTVLIHETTELRAEFAIIKAKVNEHTDDIDANKASLAALSKKKKKAACTIA